MPLIIHVRLQSAVLLRKQFHGSAATVEVEKNFAKNTYKFHISASRKPQVSSGTHYHINEMDNNANCDINGVAFKEEQMCGNHSATAGTSKVFYDVASSSNVKLTFEHLEKGKNLPMSQSKEQEITVGRSSNTSSNQRKKAWKEEKKRVREEETRRRMVAPKGQRVRLVSQEMLGVLVNRNAEKVPFFTNHTEAPAINEMEFPTVEESRKPRIKLNEDLSSGVRGDDQEGSRTDEVQVELSNLGSNNSYCDQSSNTEWEAILPASSMSSRNRKRKDPIQIDLMNLIKTQPSRCNRGQGEKGGVSKVGRWVQKGDSRVWYSGNQLDASNPERKRGKKKEVPKKKKVTVLKNAILEERALRQKLRASQEQKQDVNIQPESSQEQVDGITVVNGDDEMTADSWVKRTAPDRPPSKTKENVDLCVTETDVFEEVAGGGNFKKAGDMNITEILDLTQHVQEKLSLSTDDKAKILLQNISHVPENAQEAIKTTGIQEDDCTVVLPESPKHGCTDVIQRFFVHSRRFREYCDNSLTVPLNSAVKLLLKDIVKFQDRQYHRDPVKAFAKRRYVLGFREAKKHLQLKRLKLIVVAPDLEVAKVKGGIDDTIAQLKEDSTAQGVPCLFALSRRELGFVTFRKVGVSSVGICSYEGSEENFKNVMEHLTEARRHYKEQTRLTLTAPTVGAVSDPDSDIDENASVTDQVIASMLSKLTGNSSGDSSSVFISAIEHTANQETEL